MARASGSGDTWASTPSVWTLGGEQAAVERLGAVDLGRHGELRLDALGAHAGHGLGLLGILDHAEDDAGEGSDVARGKEVARVLVGDELGIALELGSDDGRLHGQGLAERARDAEAGIGGV